MDLNNITIKEVFEKAIMLETKLDMMEKTNTSSIKRFRSYSLFALFLIVINITISILHILISLHP